MTAKAKNNGFKPGTSGNPAGRPKGSGSLQKLREQIGEHVPDIIAKLSESALAGDVGAARLLLERAIAPLKAIEVPAPITLPDGSLTDQGRAVLTAAGTGQLAPTQAAQLLAGLGALAKLTEVDELTKRIEALERKGDGKH